MIAAILARWPSAGPILRATTLFPRQPYLRDRDVEHARRCWRERVQYLQERQLTPYPGLHVQRHIVWSPS